MCDSESEGGSLFSRTMTKASSCSTGRREIIDLCARLLQYPEIIRARNAWLIMSAIVREGLEVPEAQPYCIWNPDFAQEDTYRQVTQRYAAMRYQVGRACAAAGYLPVDHVFVCEIRRSDDLETSINVDGPRAPAFLNGDTQRWKLDWRYTIEEETNKLAMSNSPLQEATLFCNPLPLALPTMKKGLLRQVAYERNVDRYVPLISAHSRKKFGADEARCIHKLDTNHVRARDADWGDIQRVVNTRRIMIDDIGTFTGDTPCKPWLI
ncbi:hypothetical protein BDW71DRAFT_198903 [Aspergillus fruticulosus]